MSDFKLFPENDVAELINYIGHNGTLRSVRRGETLVSVGEDTGRAFLLCSGSVKCVLPDYRGKERVLAMMFEGELVANYLSSRCGFPSLFSVVAMENVECLEIVISEHQDFFGHTHNGVLYVRSFVESLAYNHLQKTISLACLSPWERLNRLREKVPDVFQRVNMKDVAAYIGVSPETLSRKLHLQ